MNNREMLGKSNITCVQEQLFICFQRFGWENPWRDIWVLVNCLSKLTSRMVGTDESSVRALDGVRMFDNKQVTLVPATSVSSDIKQKLKNMNHPSLSWAAGSLWDVKHCGSEKCSTGDCTYSKSTILCRSVRMLQAGAGGQERVLFSK